MRQGQDLTLVLLSVFLGQLCWTQGEEIITGYYTSGYETKDVVLCSDSCKTNGGDYYWCNSRKGWDYCSPLENIDYQGYQCKDDHPCEKHGESYYWCRRKAGSWGYCGKVELKTTLHMSSTYQIECRDECLPNYWNQYYWCNTDKKWDYCSPEPGVTYKKEPCQSDCVNYENQYTRCWTGWFSWDYCGLVEPNECRYDTSVRKKRQPNNAKLFCTQPNKAKRMETRFYAEPAPNAIAEVNNNIRNEIICIISRWNNGYLGNQARSGLITFGHLRIDLQGIVNMDNQPYYNLQIQINTPRPPGTSTTVAQVFIPQNVDIPDRYVRRAFTESFSNRSRVTVCVRNCNNLPARHG